MFLEMFKEIDRRGWLVIAAVGFGNALLVVTGLVGNSQYSLIFLGVLGFLWVVFYQLARAMGTSSLELAQESAKEWQAESEFAREVVEEQIRTITELKRYDLQASGIHLDRLRTILIKRHPQMEAVISEVEHPVNMPGIVI